MSATEREHLLRTVSRTAGVVTLGILALCAAGGPETSAVRGPLPESVEAWVIPNYHLLGPDVASGGQPTESGLVWLDALGLPPIINLRAPAECTAAPKPAVQTASPPYASGNRAAGVWTVLLVMEGRTYDEAEAEGRRVGLQSPVMIAAVRRVAGAAEGH